MKIAWNIEYQLLKESGFVVKKNHACSLVYQSPEKTLTDKDATAIRNKIIKRLDQVLGAKLRS